MRADHGPLRLIADLGPALVVYFGLKLAGSSPWTALGGAVVVALTRFGWLVLRKRVTRVSTLSLAFFIATAAVVTLTGNEWLFLLKPAIGEMLFGAGILFTSKQKRYPYSLGVLRRLRRARAAELVREHDNDPKVRRRHDIVTRAWGIGMVAEALLRAIMLLTLPGWLAVAISVPSEVVGVALGVALSLRYLSGKRKRSLALRLPRA